MGTVEDVADAAGYLASFDGLISGMAGTTVA